MKRLAIALSLLALPLAVRCSNDKGNGDAGTDATAPDAQADATLDAAPDAPADAGPDAPSCSPQSPCADDAATCCNSTCTHLDKDPSNCGACGVACTKTQFCNGQACFDAIVANLCHNPSAAIVLDGLGPDEEAGVALGGAMDAGCTPKVVVRQILQSAPGTIDDAGRPLLGPGDTYVAAGGGFGQKAVAYVTSAKDAPVYVTSDNTSISFVRSSDNGVIVQAQNSTLTASHDYFVSYTAVEPQSGTLVFTVYGFYSPGTAAGAFWFQNQVMANVASFTKSFYVYEWTDTNTDGQPDAGDTFTLLGSG